MIFRQSRSPKEEYARRSDEIYETCVRSQIEESNRNEKICDQMLTPRK